METSLESQLPDFAVMCFHIDGEAGSFDMLEVKCARCSRTHWVPLSWRVLRPVTGREGEPPAYPFGRNCPNCSKVSAIPADWRVRQTQTPTNRRRIVRRRRKS